MSSAGTCALHVRDARAARLLYIEREMRSMRTAAAPSRAERETALPLVDERVSRHSYGFMMCPYTMHAHKVLPVFQRRFNRPIHQRWAPPTPRCLRRWWWLCLNCRTARSSCSFAAEERWSCLDKVPATRRACAHAVSSPSRRPKSSGFAHGKHFLRLACWSRALPTPSAARRRSRR